MFDLNKLYRTYKDKLENYFKDNNSQLENKKQTLVKQWKNLAFIIVIGFFLFLALIVTLFYSLSTAATFRKSCKLDQKALKYKRGR